MQLVVNNPEKKAHAMAISNVGTSIRKVIHVSHSGSADVMETKIISPAKKLANTNAKIQRIKEVN